MFEQLTEKIQKVFNTDPAVVSDLITLYLDQDYNPELPASIVGTIVSITKLRGNSKRGALKIGSR